MDKIVISDFSSMKPFLQTRCASLYLNNGEIIKIFSQETLDIYRLADVDIESKIINGGTYIETDNIVIPTATIYNKYGQFCGYKMRYLKNRNLNLVDKNLSFSERQDLFRYARLHKSLEDTVKKNSKVIFPDLCSCDNILIGKNESIFLIDFDEMQIGKYKSLKISSVLGNDDRHEISKYSEEHLYNKNLDKKSLIMLYFLNTFNVNLGSVNTMNPFTHQIITLEEVFSIIGLYDLEIYEKVKKIFNDNEDNVYLEYSVDKIAKDYKLKIIEHLHDNMYHKRLIKK